MLPGKLTQPKAETANEMLCPKVKAVIQRNVGFHKGKAQRQCQR